MRVLSFDSGAERMGWASVGRDNGKLYYHISDILSLPRMGTKEKYQDYRLRLTGELTVSIPALFEVIEPDEIVTEIIPPTGFGNVSQAYLANVAVTTVHTIAYLSGIRVVQVSARTVQANIAIKGRSKKITKPQVRNGVLRIFPELEDRKRDWVKVFDECDAIAIGASHLGARNA